MNSSMAEVVKMDSGYECEGQGQGSCCDCWGWLSSRKGEDHRSLVELLRELGTKAEGGKEAAFGPGATSTRPLHVIMQVPPPPLCLCLALLSAYALCSSLLVLRSPHCLCLALLFAYASLSPLPVPPSPLCLGSLSPFASASRS
jgi:hypothetical protein